MFTGIIETLGTIKAISSSGTNKTFWIDSPLFSELKVDQSLSHNGVCLTVEELKDGQHRVTAVKETLEKTTVGEWRQGDKVNLERCLLPLSRLDGHFVQGHVDTTGTCKQIRNKNGSYELQFKFPKKSADFIIEKGSISLNGISLTVFDVKKNSFKVAVIPYTWEHTNLQYLKEEQEVNLEFDLVGKYINRKLSLKG
jgi:riboflavin synthase